MSRFHKAYVDTINTKDRGNLHLVYKWSPKWSRYVNTHMYTDDMKQNAIDVVAAMNKKGPTMRASKSTKELS